MTQHCHVDKRLDTGPLKPNGDWPGYFIRGDDALSRAAGLKRMADAIEKREPAIVAAIPGYLRRFAERLESCKD